MISQYFFFFLVTDLINNVSDINQRKIIPISNDFEDC